MNGNNSTKRAPTPVVRWLVIIAVAVAMLAAASMIAPAAHATGGRSAPEVTTLAEFGSGLASGSTIGPDRALYVTDPNAGSVLRVDRRTGAVTTFADGLPTQVLGVGGAMDVAFVGGTAYVLVTLVGGDIIDGPHIGDATVGIYRLGRDGELHGARRHRGLVDRSSALDRPLHHDRGAVRPASGTAMASSSPTGTTTGCCVSASTGPSTS